MEYCVDTVAEAAPAMEFTKRTSVYLATETVERLVATKLMPPLRLTLRDD
jgi:hypothetical protein